jgi:hypothetical protein
MFYVFMLCFFNVKWCEKSKKLDCLPRNKSSPLRKALSLKEIKKYMIMSKVWHAICYKYRVSERRKSL